MTTLGRNRKRRPFLFRHHINLERKNTWRTKKPKMWHPIFFAPTPFCKAFTDDNYLFEKQVKHLHQKYYRIVHLVTIISSITNYLVLYLGVSLT